MTDSNKTNIDNDTLQHIARSLWLEEFDSSELSQNILESIFSDKNSNQAFTQRHIKLLKFLQNNHLGHTPKYKKRYDILLNNLNNLSLSKCYTRNNFLGPESVLGYKPLPENPVFNFPDIDLPQLQNQVGWHFFVGHAKDINNNNYSIQIMFWQYSLLPPTIAKECDLSDIENQVIDLHIAVTDETNNIHYRAEPTLIAGTTGLISITNKPYSYTVGKNHISSIASTNALFPANIQVYGVDQDKKTSIKININLQKNKEPILQGDSGCCPSIDGIGTLYYSLSNLTLCNEDNFIELNSQKIPVTNGKFWYDHQWGTGFKPTGALSSSYMRAIQFLKPQSPGGWDWFMVQFFRKDQEECEMSFSSIHKDAKSLYQVSEEPPSCITKGITGKFIYHNGSTQNIEGTITIDKWAKSETSPNSTHYKKTLTWYPLSFNVEIRSDIPKLYKKFIIKSITSFPQTGFFADSIEYSEGGSQILDMNGKLIGQGFIESTGYANTLVNMLKNSELPVNKKTLKFSNAESLNLLQKITAVLSFLFNWKNVKKTLKKAKI